MCTRDTPRIRLTEPTFLAVGAAFGTSKAGIGIAGLGQFKPELIMKVLHPILPAPSTEFVSLQRVFAARA